MKVRVTGGELWWEKETLLGAETETADVLYGLIRHQKPLLIVETGCANGDTAEMIGFALKRNGRGKLLTCDLDAEMVLKTRECCKNLPVEVRECRGEDLIAECETIDMLFIDSGWMPVREAEVRPGFEKLKQGGLMALHDVCQNYNQVYLKAVECFGKPGMVLDSPYGLAVFQKGEPEFKHLGVMVEIV